MKKGRLSNIGHTNRKFTKPGNSGHLSIVVSLAQSVGWPL